MRYIEMDVQTQSRALAAGVVTSRRLVLEAMSLIAERDEEYNAVLELNPDALFWADRADELYRQGTRLSSLQGIPVLIKDNISTKDGMRTSAGSLALEDNFASADSCVAEKLRALGATVVLSRQENQDSYSLDEVIDGFKALNPDLNLSIHFNALENNSPTATGTEAYWCYGNSQLLSDVLLKTFTEKTGFKYRKSERDYYKVSRLCSFPSVLFETAFLSNAKDLAWFMKDSNMDKAAAAITDGIMDFFKEQNN